MKKCKRSFAFFIYNYFLFYFNLLYFCSEVTEWLIRKYFTKMGTLKNRDNSKNELVKSNDSSVTAKGNKLITFSRVSDEERARLRVKSYGYII